MQRALFLSAIIFLTLSSASSVSRAELSEEKEKCAEALDKAYEQISQRRDSQANNLTPSSTNAEKPSESSSPLSDMMNKIAEGNAKKAEIAKQQLEQNREINTEQYKQLEAIADKEREINREKSRLPMEIKKEEFACKSQEAKIRMECQSRAQKQYDALVLGNSAKAEKSQYTVNSLSQVRGTRTRMTSLRKIYYARCLADPTTQEALQLAKDELNMKLYNFNIQAGIHNADLEYTKGKIPKLIAHMDENRRYVAESADLQMNAIDQQQQMQMMGLSFALMTSAANSTSQENSAGTFTSADQILNDFNRTIRKLCMAEDSTQPYKIPSDLVGIFDPVNRACTPNSYENSGGGCVKDSGKSSEKPNSGSIASR